MTPISASPAIIRGRMASRAATPSDRRCGSAQMLANRFSNMTNAKRSQPNSRTGCIFCSASGRWWPFKRTNVTSCVCVCNFEYQTSERGAFRLEIGELRSASLCGGPSASSHVSLWSRVGLSHPRNFWDLQKI